MRPLWLLYSPAAVVLAHLSPVSDLPEASDLMLSWTADAYGCLGLSRKKKRYPFFGGLNGCSEGAPSEGEGALSLSFNRRIRNMSVG